MKKTIIDAVKSTFKGTANEKQQLITFFVVWVPTIIILILAISKK